MQSTIKPDPQLDIERMELMEATLGPLIDRHLRWTPVMDSPSAELSDAEYGYLPEKFGMDDDTETSLRPKQEPLDFRIIAGEVLGIDSESLSFEDEVRKIDGHGDYPESPRDYRTEGWYRFLERSGLSKEEVMAMKEVSEIAFGVSANTEDNTTAYELETMGRIRILEEKYGLVFPAHREWYRGVWIAEEDAHKEGQNDYGRIRRLTTSLKHKASRTSQLRIGTEVNTSLIFGMAIYTTVQEFSTRLAHKRNAILFGPVGYRLQEEESQDETKHYDLYGKLVRAAYQDPRFTEEIITLFSAKSEDFRMPGDKGIANFKKKAIKIAQAKIYGSEEEAEAMKMAMKHTGMLDKDANGNYVNPDHISEVAQIMLDALRDQYDVVRDQAKKRRGLFVLGQTITVHELKNLHKEYTKEKGLPDLKMRRIKKN